MLLTSTCLAADERTIRAEILAMDDRFFAAFNACDIETMGRIFSASLEFYHDVSGYSGYEKTMEVTRGNCERKLGLRRTLVEASTQVHALGEFGALQTGRHTFCHQVDGVDDCGTFDFVHVWKREADGGASTASSATATEASGTPAVWHDPDQSGLFMHGSEQG